jgi:nicotinamidase-related amidase
MNPALLVIDIQRGMFSKPERQPDLQVLIPQINELIDFFHGLELPIIHVMTVHKADGSTGDLWMRRNNRISMVDGTPDAEECPEIHRYETDAVVRKTRHSAFIRTDLESVLGRMQADTVVLTGFATNACVGLTAIEAYERDFDVLLSQEATLGCDQPRADLMLKYLHTEFAINPVPISTITERIAAAGTDRA